MRSTGFAFGCLLVVLARGAVAQTPLGLLNVNAQTQAVPVTATPVTAAPPDSVVLDDVLAQLRALVVQSRSLVGAGVEPLAGEKATQWAAARASARDLSARFWALVKASSATAASDGKVASAMEAEYVKLRAAYAASGVTEVPAAEALRNEAAAVKVQTEHTGFLAGTRDQLGWETDSLLAGGSSPQRQAFYLERAVGLLPWELVDAMNQAIRSATEAARDNGRLVMPYFSVSVRIPNAESSAQLEARHAALRALLQEARALVPSDRAAYLPRTGATFQKFSALSADFTRQYKEYATALQDYLQAQTGTADRAFKTAMGGAFAATKITFSRSVLQPDVASYYTILADGKTVRARAGGETEGLMGLVSDKDMTPLDKLTWTPDRDRIMGLVGGSIAQDFASRWMLALGAIRP